jgi:hypothetical protein
VGLHQHTGDSTGAFARLSRSVAAQKNSREEHFKLVNTATVLVICVFVPTVVLGCSLAPWASGLWLGEVFENKSTLIT